MIGLRYYWYLVAVVVLIRKIILDMVEQVVDTLGIRVILAGVVLVVMPMEVLKRLMAHIQDYMNVLKIALLLANKVMPVAADIMAVGEDVDMLVVVAQATLAT